VDLEPDQFDAALEKNEPLGHRAEVNPRDREDLIHKDTLKKQQSGIVQKIIRDFHQFEELSATKQVVFDFKMPDDLQRVMLFEKLEYFLHNNHDVEMQNPQDKMPWPALIKKIKELYRTVNPVYKE